MTYVLDTNIVTALLKGNESVKDRLKNVVMRGEDIFISAICYYEIKRGLLDANAAIKLSKFNQFCKLFRILMLDTQSIFDRATEIYVNLKQKGELINDADILIASSAMEHDLILVTSDSDFNRIPDIKIENWLCRVDAR